MKSSCFSSHQSLKHARQSQRSLMKRTMKLCLIVFTILAVLSGSLAARLGIWSASEKDQDWCKIDMGPDKYSLVNSVCEDCADIFRNYPGVYGLCK